MECIEPEFPKMFQFNKADHLTVSCYRQQLIIIKIHKNTNL